MLDPKISNLEILNLRLGWGSNAFPNRDVEKFINRQFKLKELQIICRCALTNGALALKRLYFSHIDAPISTEFLRKSKETLEVLEFFGDPTQEIFTVIVNDLERLQALSVYFMISANGFTLNELPPSFKPNKSIETLQLKGSIQDSFNSALLENLPNVKRLCCGVDLTHDQWSSISMNMTQIEEINFSDTSSNQFSNLIFPSVTTISFSSSEIFCEFKDQILLKSAFPNVKTLKIYSNILEDGYGYDCLEIIRKHWSHLRRIELRKGFQLSVKQLIRLFDSCLMLENLILDDESIVLKSTQMFNQEMEMLKDLHKKGLCSVERVKLDYRNEILNFTE